MSSHFLILREIISLSSLGDFIFRVNKDEEMPKKVAEVG